MARRAVLLPLALTLCVLLQAGPAGAAAPLAKQGSAPAPTLKPLLPETTAATAAALVSGASLAGALPAAAPKAVPGSVWNGSLASGDITITVESRDYYVDYYPVEWEAGSTVSVSLASGDFDAYVFVFQTDNTDVNWTDDDGGGGVDAFLQIQVPQTGAYMIAVTSSTVLAPESGEYELGVLVGQGLLSSLGPGDATVTVDSRAYFCDYDTLTWTAGATVRLFLSSDEFDAYLDVRLRSDSGVHWVDDDGGDGLDSYLEIEVPQTGDYVVQATSSPAVAPGSGSYLLVIDTGGGPAFDAGGTVTLADQTDRSGVTISFERLSGTGPVPAAVQTDAAGHWEASGFQSGTNYRVTPTRTGWAFTPGSLEFSTLNDVLDFTGEVPVPTLLVRAVVGTARLTSPAQIVVGRRVQFAVLRSTLADQRDSTAVPAFSLNVPASLGTVSGSAVRLTTVAGVSGTVTVTAADLSAQFTITTLPGSVDHLVIQPAEVSLSAGQQVDFNARGVDSYGNEFALAGVSLGWHCWPATLGTINANTGLFTAATSGGTGCVIAVVSRTLRFGDTDVSAAGTGKVVVRGARPEAFVLHQNTPNPFNPQTTVRFDLPEPSQVRLEVFDCVGRLVRVLAEGGLPAGQHQVAWDGTDQSGTALASGIYLVRMEAGPFVQVRKALLVR